MENNLTVISPEPVSQEIQSAFSLIIPKPFSLSDQPKAELDKIRSEIMEKEMAWERRMDRFFEGYFTIADSWRIKPRPRGNADRKQIFNSKSGETHRGTETLGTVWQRMLTASDPWFSAVARGLGPNGRPLTEEDIYVSEGVLQEQLRANEFKRKGLRSFRSTAMTGFCMIEYPFISLPYGHKNKRIEYTDWVFRPMIRSGFDMTTVDPRMSDYVFFIDFVSKWSLLNDASQDTEFWDMAAVEKHTKDYSNGVPAGNSEIYSRILQSRARAGYSDLDTNVYENIGYHGRLERNPVLEAYAESVGLETDVKYVDWSVNVLDGMDIAKFHMTQYGDWRTRVGVLSYKEFEDEPLPYGVGQIGRKQQRMMDIGESLADNKAIFDSMNMFKIGKYSGYDQKQLVAEPLKFFELEDINQLSPLVGDPNVLKQLMALIELRREDFRNTVGAQTNLQAQITKASATESAIAQNEAMRNAGVHAEILAETVRRYLEISHINNLNYLDEPIWVSLTGTQKPMLVDKSRLPENIGFVIKMVTDKDFRPERIKNINQALQMILSGNTFMPSSINAMKPLMEELFRALDINPRKLNEPMSARDYMETHMNRLMNSGRLKSPEMQGDYGREANVEEVPPDVQPNTMVPEEMSA